MFLGVPAHSVRSVGVDLDLEDDRVVLDVALVGVEDIRPGHVAAEAPVILLGVEVVCDVPGEGCPVLLVNHLEVGRGVTRPGTGLGLSIALQEEANTLCVAILNKVLL